MRVLVMAENANPEWISVPLVGWSHAKALSQQVDTHLVTQIRCKEAIERTGWQEGKEFAAIDSEKMAARMHALGNRLRGGKGVGWTTDTALSAFDNYYYEHLVWERFKDALKAGEFDLVHRLVPLSPTAPSLMVKKLSKIGVPFVMGPLNGGLPWPKEFDSARRKEKEWLSYVRDVYKLLPGYRSSRKHASAIICGSRETLRQMPAFCKDKCVYIPENAIDPSRFAVPQKQVPALPLKVVFVGRLVPYKGPDMLLEALEPLLREGKVVLRYLGDGPMMSDLQSAVKERQIPGVALPGWIEHSQMQSELINADVFGFPSIREFGGAVVLEAMAAGCVPVVVNYGGPGELITKETGFGVPMGTRAELVARFAKQFEHMVENVDQLAPMQAAGVRHVFEEFTWEAKAKKVVALYEQVLNGTFRGGDSLK